MKQTNPNPMNAPVPLTSAQHTSQYAGNESSTKASQTKSDTAIEADLERELYLTPQALQERADILDAESCFMMHKPDNSLSLDLTQFERSALNSSDKHPINKKNLVILTNERELYQKITAIDRLMRELVKGKEPLVTPIVNPAVQQPKYKMSKLAHELVHRLKGCNHIDALYCFPMFQFNPWLTLYFQLSKALEDYLPTVCSMGYRIVSPRIQGYEPDVLHFVHALNHFAVLARKQARSPEFINTVRNFKRSEHNNFEGLATLVKRLFDNHARLLVVRIDLGFKKYCPLLSAEPGRTVPQAHDYASAKATFQGLLRAMRAKSGCFEHLLAYAWKAEIGMERGIHFHTVAFFDGAKVRQDAVYGELMGKYWVNDITQGEGHYYNCNRDKTNYRECGVGMINHSDIDKRQILHRRVLPYLTKSRSLLKTQFGKQYRSFGRSEIPNGKDGKKGRKRKPSLLSQSVKGLR